MTSFHDVSWPFGIGMGASMGPEWRTEIVTLASGQERRNSPWRGGRRRFDLGGGRFGQEEAHAMIAFFEARRGRLHAFRLRDPLDWKSCAPTVSLATTDQVIGIGDGAQTAFQLVKTYGVAPSSVARIITKPVMGSVIIALNGAPSQDFSLDALTGVVTLNAAPAVGVAISAGFEFDTPVRFETDRLDFVLDAPRAVRLSACALLEVLG